MKRSNQLKHFLLEETFISYHQKKVDCDISDLQLLADKNMFSTNSSCNLDDCCWSIKRPKKSANIFIVFLSFSLLKPFRTILQYSIYIHTHKIKTNKHEKDESELALNAGIQTAARCLYRKYI